MYPNSYTTALKCSVQMATNGALIDDGLKARLEEFFSEYYDSEVRELEDEMVDSITINYQLLREFSDKLADDLANNPSFWFENAEAALKEYDDDELDIENPRILLKDYDKYDPAIRDLRDKHLGRVISVDGVVSKATSVLPKAEVAAFECKRCGGLTRVKQPLDSKLRYPSVCSDDDCQNRSENAFRINVSQSDKINFRKIEIQEPPEETSGGKTPESETFTVKGEVATNVSAGDNVKAIGVYKGAEQGDTSVFRTYIRGNNIIPEEQEFEEIEISEQEVDQIKELSEKDEIYALLRDSIAPSLFGLENEKLAVLYQLFGGVRKTEMDGTKIRGDIHVLFVGDPGTGKSQLIRYASKLSPRGVLTNGKGASEAGITAAAVRDSEFGGEDKWTLKAGALVLADKGLAAVDELDKMDASDRSAMHEGLEQQRISISKAGINATLKSRCTLLGAANPKDGRWNDFDPVPAQIDLEPALISRFDLIFAPTDDRTEKRDTKLADHILMTNLRGQQLEAGLEPDEESEEVEPDVSPELFRKYVAYAKKNCKPVMSEEAMEYIRDFFVDIREEGEEEGAIPVTARKIEGLVRLSESAARIQLSNIVTEDHAKRAIDIVEKSLMDVGYDKEEGRFDVDMTETSTSTSQRERKNKLKEIIEELQDEGEKGAPRDMVMEAMTDELEFNEDDVDYDLRKLCRDGKEVYEPVTNEYRLL